MKLNRRSLRRLIESIVLENNEASHSQVVPKEVRDLALSKGLKGMTAIAFDKENNEGLAVMIERDFRGNHEDKLNNFIGEIEKLYGKDRVKQTMISKLKRGSAGVKHISPNDYDHNRRLGNNKGWDSPELLDTTSDFGDQEEMHPEELEELFLSREIIFIKY